MIIIFVSAALIMCFAVGIVFANINSSEKSSKKYESVISDADYDFFPNSLPKDAKNTEFHYIPGVWLARSKAYVKFEITKEYLNEYELLHGGDDVTKETSIDAWVQRHIESSEICKRIDADYLNDDNCDLYVKTEGFSIQGYVIKWDTNEIFIFYDGFD